MFSPGTAFSYSSYNFTLLSAAIESASQKKFNDYAREQIFAPLAMSSTGPDDVRQRSSNIATCYEVKEGKYKQVYPVDNSNKWAGGGFISSTQDLVKFGNAMLHNKILSSSVVDTLFAPTRLNNGEVNEEGYALGWRVSKEKKMFNGSQLTYIVHHGGTALGSTCFLVLFPDHQITVAVIMNRSAPADFRDFSKYAFRIAEKFIKQREDMINGV